MLRLIYDISADELRAAYPAEPPRLPVSHRAAISVTLLDDKVARPLVTGDILQLRLCAADKFDSTPLATLALTIADVTTTGGNVYTGELDCLNTAVQTLLGINGDTTDDQTRAQCRLDIGILETGETYYAPCGQSLTVDLCNNNFAEGAAAPFTRPGGLFTPFAITALTGGLATTLDGVSTVNEPAGTCIWTDLSGSIALYRLFSGTDAESSPGIIRPDDYNASTNAKVWKEIL